jgi:hypothetical protein
VQVGFVGKRVAHNVVGRHGDQVPPFGFGPPGQVFGPQQALFFALHRHEDHRARKLPFGHDPGHFHDNRYPGGVVVGAGGLAGAVHDVGIARIEVAAHDQHPVVAGSVPLRVAITFFISTRRLIRLPSGSST